MPSDAGFTKNILRNIPLSKPQVNQPLPTSKKELQGLLRAQQQGTVDDIMQALAPAIEEEIQRQINLGVAQKVQEILESIRLARHRQFGSSSERQGQLFNEAEHYANDELFVDPHIDSSPAPAAKAPTRKRGKRRPLPPELPRIERIIEHAQANKPCGCGSPLVKIGEDISEQLDVIPMKIIVRRTVRPIYACPKGDSQPIQASAPAQILPRSNFSAGLLATLLTVKYADGLPLNRFATVLKRHGVDIPRQSLARAVIKTAQALQPLHNLMRDTLLESPIIHMDETTVQVLKEKGRNPTSKSYMWVQRAGPPGQSIILFDYEPSRAAKVPLELLQGWQGYLMTDGYKGYGAIGSATGVTALACMAHARRRFVEAQRAQPKGKTGRADEALRYFAKLYRIEREIKALTLDERTKRRQTESKAVLVELHDWLEENIRIVTPRSKLGVALAYLQKMWPQLQRYTERGDLPIDNNPCENAIRPFVVGRKAWLFSDTPAGAHASAVIYSLVETAKANGKEPQAWLHYALERLPLVKNADEMEQLLPWNTSDEDLAMNLMASE